LNVTELDGTNGSRQSNARAGREPLLAARRKIERLGNLNLPVSFNPQRLDGPAR
jgi:hypothetical protein